jgi:hypothetical protein
MFAKSQRYVRSGMLALAGLVALAVLISHALVNARATADYRALGVLPFELRWQGSQLSVGAISPDLARDGGLQPGDRILRIGAEPIGDTLQQGHDLFWRARGQLLRRDERIVVTVLQNGLLREVAVSLRGITPSQERRVSRIRAMMLPKQIAGFCLWLLGVLVLVRRRDSVTCLFFLWCMALAMYTASSAVAVFLWASYPYPLVALFRTGFTAGWFFAPPLFGHFCHVYVGNPRQGRRRFLRAVSFLAAAIAFLWIGLLSPAGGGLVGRLVWLGLAGSWLVALATGLTTLLRAGRRTPDSLRRKQLQFVLAGSLAYVLVFLQTFVGALIGWDADPTTISAWLPHVLLLVTPLALAYAILRHRLLDLDVIIRCSLVYTGLTLCMAGLFILLQQLAGAVLQAKAGATSLPAQTLAAMVVAALFGPAERRLGRFVESIFNRRKRSRLHQLHQLGREIRLIADPVRLEQILVDRTAQLFEVERAALMWWDADAKQFRGMRGCGMPVSRRRLDCGVDDGLAVRLARDRKPLDLTDFLGEERDQPLQPSETARLTALGAGLCVPLSAGGRLAGILILGARPDDDVYTSEEKEALLALGDLAAAGLRQAELERRLAELQAERVPSTSNSRAKASPLPCG